MEAITPKNKKPSQTYSSHNLSNQQNWKIPKSIHSIPETPEAPQSHYNQPLPNPENNRLNLPNYNKPIKANCIQIPNKLLILIETVLLLNQEQKH